MEKLLDNISQCRICEQHLQPNPVLTASSRSKIIIVGQAPGARVHATGIPWNDKSGERLREWLDVNENQFYNPDLFGIIPMGFCYPGKGKSGDLGPRKECAPLWHNALFEKMHKPELIVLVGNYAQKYYLKDTAKANLTETVKSYKNYLPQYFVLPHPSPRNNIWMTKNDWFENEVIPELKNCIKSII